MKKAVENMQISLIFLFFDGWYILNLFNQIEALVASVFQHYVCDLPGNGQAFSWHFLMELWPVVDGISKSGRARGPLANSRQK